MQDGHVDGHKLRDLREKAGLRRPDLAKQAGISVSHLRHIECEHRQPSRIVVLALSGALAVPVEAFTSFRRRAA